jgi:ketosteroid isomerase-like protein
MTEWDNHQTVRRLFEAFEKHDPDLIEQVLDKDFSQESRGLDESIDEDAHPSSVKPIRILAAGDAVVVLAHWDFDGYEAVAVSLFEFSDGKIVRQLDFFGDPFDPTGGLPSELLEAGDDAAENRKVAEAYWKALEKRDLDAIEDLRADHFVMEWPQSGERVRGKQFARTIEDSYEGQADLRPRRILGKAGVWVIEATINVGSDRSHMVSVLEIESGRIVRQTDYFGDPFPAPDWRANLVEKMGE